MVTLEQRTNNLKEKLKEQINLTAYQINIGGFNNVMYGFVEVIESDPIFSKFIKAKIDEEFDMKDRILKEKKDGNIDDETEQRLFDLYLRDAFWHQHYCVFKQAHDVIKIDKCESQGVVADNICRAQIFWYGLDNRDYGKKLSDEKIEEYINDFNKCYDIIVGLINSNQKLLNKINDEYLKTPTKKALIDKWENIQIKFLDEFNIKLTIKGKEEKSDYEKLGFADLRKNSPERSSYVNSWKLLQLFSTQEGKINMYSRDQKDKDYLKKTKQGLSKRLKEYFGLNSDPIIHNEQKQEYKIKIKLIPSPDFRDDWRDRNIKEEADFRNKEYLN
jgi:hypothetical protein